MDSRLSKARGSLKNEKEGTSSEKYEVSYKELSSLMRIRDFISLLLTYPMKLDEEGILKSWICAFPEWKAQLLSTRDHTVIDKPWRVLTEKALRLIEGFMPMEMISKIESGERSIFSHNDAIPEAIIHLTVDLAVNQLIQTLFSSDYSACYHYVRLLTRNLTEKRCVVNKIVAALEEKHNMCGVDKDFVRALWINASTYETDAEVRVQEEINTKLAGSFVSNRHLVIVVDADSNKKLDLQKVHFPAGIVVLISTEPSMQAEKDDEFRITCAMDLNIRTQDHLLSWEVFCSYLDRRMVLVRSPVAIQRIAVEIVKECHGHLLATVLVAKYLKNVEDVEQWVVALYKLSNVNPFYDYQESDRIGISRVMVNAFLNIIWEDIDDRQKLCLEFSLFDHNIKNGVQHAILVSDWASILLEDTQEMTLNLDEVRENTRAKRYIRELLDRFVLLEYESRDVYLPVETYDIIKSLHTSDPSIIRHGVLGLTEAPYIGRWHGLIRIELMDNKICELPQSPDCPKLEVLLLQGNIDLMDIPDSFFNHMPLLQHLDLSSTSIRDLPPSLSKLMQLEKFYLRGCDLFMEIPPQIGQLKNLKELNLDGTLITHLPREIRELMNLQSLTLCVDGYHHVLLGQGKKGKQISNSTIIPRGVISNLTRLKYLNIKVDPEDERWNENFNWVFMEIFGLKWLETVSIYVPEANLLKLMPVHKSLNFRLVVGHHMQRFISRVTPEVEQKFKRCDYSIKLVNGENVPNAVKMNLGNFKALYLDRHMTIKSLSDFDLRNLSWLQVCILAECNEMKSIVNRGYAHDGHALPNLEFLSVFYMKNLRSICESPNPSFLHLKSIALHTCPMLTTVFTLDSLNNLSFLEEIIIEDCPKVTTLVSLDSPKQTTQFSLPRLRRILLLYLPELLNIFNGLHVEQDLQQMVFYYCPKLQSLSKSELSSKSLKIIKGESMWWEALKWNAAEWGDAGRPKHFEQIFSPINEEADLMNQLAAHQETQINTDQDEFLLQRKKKISVPLEELSPPALRESKESHTFGKLVKATHEQLIIEDVFKEETVQSNVDDDLDEVFEFRPIIKRFAALNKPLAARQNTQINTDQDEFLMTKRGCPSHPQEPMQLKPHEAPYRCSGCLEVAIGHSYQCGNNSCNYILDEKCANADSFAFHPFFRDSDFKFHEKAPGHRVRYCDACGKDVLGFVYHCSSTGYDLHPCCLKLKREISDEQEGVTLKLCKQVRKKCGKCKHRNVVDHVKGWSYVSSGSEESYCYHVSCAKELILENLNSTETNSTGMSDREYSQLALMRSMEIVPRRESSRSSGKIRKYTKKIAVFKLIFSAIFGNPISLMPAVLETLVSD